MGPQGPFAPGGPWGEASSGRGPAPTPFFEDGTPTHTQRFYQLTLLVLTEKPPEALKPLAEEAAKALGEVLEGLPPGVGWLLLEDLRPL
ncbi:hypothetical protein RLTM_02100 [Thermus parvatiensis]|uniref:Uncharacterized protein n=1 Tax=Thermus parvatiensis TaxID=456163 RepID=H7GEB8_9DEIN|nr:hypothetical protein RLTM_02100 [Thermus parvatiensis]